MRLNIGCGFDYREGFINIDGSNELPKVDLVIEISSESMLEEFDENEVDQIVCRDIIEHYFHWESVNLMRSFYHILKNNGGLWIQVPNTEFIIKSDMPIEKKVRCLYGNQDINGPGTPFSESRNKFPQFHCHKYGWTPAYLEEELGRIGFVDILINLENNNFTIQCKVNKCKE